MRRQAIITLAGRGYIVGPLTVGQAEDVLIAAAAPDPNAPTDPKAAMKAQFKRNREIIAVAIGNPDLTAESIETSTEITRAEIVGALDVILEMSGLVPKKTDDNPGEAAPAAE